MIEAILDFLSPIYFIALTGSYALLQNLQALGITSVWNGAFIDLQGTVNVISEVYFLFLLLLCLVNLVSSAALSNKLSLTLLFVWISPCVLHSLGLFTIRPIIPNKFTIGSGGPDQIGLPEGALINSIAVVLLSWSISTIFLHAFRTGKRFKSFFDHVWYLFGVSAIVFYVSDQSTVVSSGELTQSRSIINSSFSRLDNELRRLNNGCLNGSYTEYKYLCLWSEPSKNYIERFKNMNDVEIILSKAPNIEELLSITKDYGVNIDYLKAEIGLYNTDYCVNTAYCSSLGVELNSHPGLLKGEVNPYTKYALSLEAVMPTITREWDKFKKLMNETESKSAKENKRWIIFVFISSILIGIKISNSSRELFGGRECSIYRKGILTIIKIIGSKSSKLVNSSRTMFNKALQRISR